MPNINEIKECPDCASPNIVRNEEREQIICRECGLIYEPLTPVEEELFEKTHNLAEPKKAKKPVKQPAKKSKAKKKK